jgi:hypothetical protein
MYGSANIKPMLPNFIEMTMLPKGGLDAASAAQSIVRNVVMCQIVSDVTEVQVPRSCRRRDKSIIGSARFAHGNTLKLLFKKNAFFVGRRAFQAVFFFAFSPQFRS